MREEILKKDIGSLFIKFVIPAVVGMLVNAMYIIVDGIFIGNGVGELGLASVNIDFPVLCINMAIAMLFGVGSSILISIKCGEGKKEDAEKLLGTTVLTVLVIGAIITVLGLTFLEPIMVFLGAQGEVLVLTMDYSRIIFMFTIAYILSCALNPIVRADGNPALAMTVLVVGAVVNVILDWLFVIKLGYGMKGAAWATVIGMTLSGSYLLFYFFSGKSNVKLRMHNLKFDFYLLRLIIISGFVSFGIQVSLGIMTLIQNKLLLKYGTMIDVSVFAIVGYISVMSAQVLVGVAEGIQPIIGYNYGAGNIERTKKTLRLTIKVDFVLGFLFLFLFIFAGDFIVSIFNTNPEIVELASRRLLMYLAGVPVVGLVYTFANYYQAMKKNMYANLISMGRSFMYLLPSTLILPMIIGVEGVFIAPAIADYCAVVTVIVIILREKKLNKSMEIQKD
ncbi:MAG: MATE family efflux transporter [Clostridium sp.]